MANPWDADEIVGGNPWDADEVVAPAKPQAKPKGNRAGQLAARSAGRGLASTADNLRRGVSMLPTMSLYGALMDRLPGFREVGDLAMTQGGLAQPETSGERIAVDVGDALTQNALTMGAGAAGNVRFLTANPALQLAGTTTGTTAASTVRENGGGQVAQTIAGLVGGLSPAAASTGTLMAARGAARGGAAGRQNMMETLADFDRAGTSASVGQASGNRVMRALETLLSRTPGGAGVMNRFAERQADEIGARANQMADDLAPGADPVSAGTAIERGILGPGGYNERLRHATGRAYGALDRHIDADAPTAIPNTMRTLRGLADPVPGARATSAQMRDPKLANILDALEADSSHPAVFPGVAAQQTVPFRALKAQRSEVGQMVGDAKYGRIGTPERQLSATYGAMSEDMRGAARASGPKAERALDRANGLYARGAERTKQLAKIVNKDAPEKVYAAAMAGTKGGATQLEALMQSLPREAQQTVAAAVIKRMGRAANHMQDGPEAGTFSAERFKNAWVDMSPQAQQALFGRLPPEVQQQVASIVRVGANIQKGSRIFANPSGTAAAVTQGVGASSALTALLTGNPGAAGAVIGGGVAANGLARLMTNPRSARWLANETRMPVGVGNVPAFLLPGQSLPNEVRQPQRRKK